MSLNRLKGFSQVQRRPGFPKSTRRCLSSTNLMRKTHSTTSLEPGKKSRLKSKVTLACLQSSDLVEINNNFVISVTSTEYNREEIPYFRFRPEPVAVKFDVKQLNLSPLQQARFEFLAEKRYNTDTGVCTINIHQFLDKESNQARALEVVQELILESLRAPRE